MILDIIDLNYSRQKKGLNENNDMLCFGIGVLIGVCITIVCLVLASASDEADKMQVINNNKGGI